MAEYMGKLTPAQNEALATMPRRGSTPDYFAPYRALIGMMADAAGEMAEAGRHNLWAGADNVGTAQNHAARALNEAIDALEHAQFVLHVG